MKLIKTSCQLDSIVMEKLKTLYPNLEQSELIRAALEYLLLKEPAIEQGFRFTDSLESQG